MWVYFFMEIWKDIIDYEGIYQISNLGRVKSLERTVFVNRKKGAYFLTYKEKIMKNFCDSYGYFMIALMKDGKKKTKKIHKLVAIAFLGHTPCGYNEVVDHINNNHKDNRVENLRLVTARENTYKDKPIGKYTSNYKGVYYDKSQNKWIARINIKFESFNLGSFKNEIDARDKYLLALNNINNGLHPKHKD
jgi:hypothetical protein